MHDRLQQPVKCWPLSASFNAADTVINELFDDRQPAGCGGSPERVALVINGGERIETQ